MAVEVSRPSFANVVLVCAFFCSVGFCAISCVASILLLFWDAVWIWLDFHREAVRGSVTPELYRGFPRYFPNLTRWTWLCESDPLPHLLHNYQLDD